MNEFRSTWTYFSKHSRVVFVWCNKFIIKVEKDMRRKDMCRFTAGKRSCSLGSIIHEEFEKENERKGKTLQTFS